MNYYDSFMKYWFDNYKRIVFKAKIKNDIKQLLEVKDHIWQNWNLIEEQKNTIFKKLGIWRIK